MALHALIMAGGAGTRFWPRSRARRPKQFLPLAGRRALLRETLERVAPLLDDRCWILTREDLREGVAELLPELPSRRIVCEPEMRDTAPALILGCAVVERLDPEATLLVLPADHVIPDADTFRRCVASAAEQLAARGGLVTFGIPPRGPATGFGYVERVEGVRESVGGFPAYPVRAFREKPSVEVARTFVESGRHYWNAGIFLWRLDAFERAVARYAPEHHGAWRALRDLDGDLSEAGRMDVAEIFRSMPRISIDYALLERAEERWVVEAPFEWDDVGSWTAAEGYLPPDSHGNRCEGRAVFQKSESCTVFAGGRRVVALLGVDDLIVVESEDAVLVCRRADAGRLKEVTAALQERGWGEVL